MKITQTELEKLIKEVIEKEQLVRAKSLARKRALLNSLKRAITIPIIIGIIAALTMYFIYGIDELVYTLLNWTIGLTIAAAIISTLKNIQF